MLKGGAAARRERRGRSRKPQRRRGEETARDGAEGAGHAFEGRGDDIKVDGGLNDSSPPPPHRWPRKGSAEEAKGKDRAEPSQIAQGVTNMG